MFATNRYVQNTSYKADCLFGHGASDIRLGVRHDPLEQPTREHCLFQDFPILVVGVHGEADCVFDVEAAHGVDGGDEGAAGAVDQL